MKNKGITKAQDEQRAFDIIKKSQTFADLWQHAEYYLPYEGGQWYRTLGLSSYTTPVHGLRFHNGATWDIFSGFRALKHLVTPELDPKPEGEAHGDDVLTAQRTP